MCALNVEIKYNTVFILTLDRSSNMLQKIIIKKTYSFDVYQTQN